MPNTLLLDLTNWDLVLDINGNIAVASEPYSLAQDAASACKTFLGEMYLDTTLGVPMFSRIFGGQAPPMTLLKKLFVTAALTVPGVVSAQFFFISFSNRVIAGQIQVTSSDGRVSAATFSIVNPQGAG
jgi:hypothetical protein